MNPDESLAQAYAEELPWLAFLYVSEELTPDEVVDFEERLLSDQSAREAVGQVMQLADGVWLASAMDSLSPKPEICPAPWAIGPDQTRRRGGFSRLALWMGSTLAAAALAFCVGWWFAGQSYLLNPVRVANQTDSKPALLNDADSDLDGAEELVGLWTESHDLLAELGTGSASEFPSEASEYDHVRDAIDSEDEAFAWMLAAVSAASGELPQVTPEVMEN